MSRANEGAIVIDLASSPDIDRAHPAIGRRQGGRANTVPAAAAAAHNNVIEILSDDDDSGSHDPLPRASRPAKRQRRLESVEVGVETRHRAAGRGTQRLKDYGDDGR